MMTSAVDAERDKCSMMNFEETELRLGLPGGGGSGNEIHESTLKNTSKRDFSQTFIDLKHNLSSSNNDLPSVVAKDKNSTPTHALVNLSPNDQK